MGVTQSKPLNCQSSLAFFFWTGTVVPVNNPARYLQHPLELLFTLLHSEQVPILWSSAHKAFDLEDCTSGTQYDEQRQHDCFFKARYTLAL